MNGRPTKEEGRQNRRDEPSPGSPATTDAVVFGPFRLVPAQRLLLEADEPLRLGSRAIDILLALVERAGELVPKQELMARVWPRTTVVEANLLVHIAALRRALRDGRNGERYIVNTPGRGYRFVAPVTIVADAQTWSPPAAAAKVELGLTATLTRLIGREREIDALREQIAQTRLVTLTGPGGVGKSRVALGLAERLASDFPHGVPRVDLARVADPGEVPSAVAAVLLPDAGASDHLALSAALLGKSLLLVLDNCEHLVEVVAALTVALLRASPGIRVLATSREPLRVEGEHVRRLAPLATPTAPAGTMAAEALGFAAVELFVERAAAMGAYRLTDADAPLVSQICRSVDGLPLAIDLAASRMEGLGVRGIAARLHDPFKLLTAGRRAALPRHQSLTATLDWSYALLSPAERVLLRRLASFDGAFSLGDIAAATPGGEVTDVLMRLVAKSLVVADAGDPEPSFRLFETTRAYVLGKGPERGHVERFGERIAEHRRAAGRTDRQPRAAAAGLFLLRQRGTPLD